MKKTKMLTLQEEDCVFIIDPKPKEAYIYAYDPAKPNEAPHKVTLKPKTEKDFQL